VALKKLLNKMCQEPSRWKFVTMCDDMVDRNNQIKEWLIEPKRLAVLYDGCYRYKYMTINLSKIFKIVLKIVHGLLVMVIMQITFFYYQYLFC
jgi:hypothetical protein